MTKAHKSVLDGVVETVVPGTSLTVNNSDPKNPVINARIANQATAEAGTDNEQLMTALGVAQSIAKNSPPTDTSALALALADLQGSRLVMKGGVADPFDDESGVNVNSGNDTFTKLLLHGETLTDSSPMNNSLVVGSGITASTAQSIFGGSSLGFTGAGRIQLSSDSEDLELLDRSFTIDFWMRATNPSPAQEIITKRSSESSYDGLLFRLVGGVFNVYLSSTNSSWNILSSFGSSFSVAANTWYHVALVRDVNNWYIFRNGVLAGSTSTSTNPSVINGTTPWKIGGSADGTGLFNGWLDEFRISIGVARWTSDFTPPSKPYANPTGASQNQAYDAALDLYRPTIAGSTTTYTNTLGTGDRTSIITVTQSPTIYNNGTPSNLVDGGFLFDNNDTLNNSGAPTANDGNYFQFAFGSLKYIDEVRLYANGSGSNGNWKWQYSVDGTSFTDLNTFAWVVTGSPVLVGVSGLPPTGCTHLRMTKVGTTTLINGYFQEVEFKIADGGATSNNMTLISVPYATTTQPTYARLVLQIDTPLTITANTDLQGQVSRDGGTTWATANLQLASTLGNIKTYQDDAVDLSGIGAGTNIVWRARTLTNKNIPISGVVTQWR